MIAILQFLGVLWAAYATGTMLIVALAVAMAAIYAQVTVNDLVIARYTADAWRGRVYAVRYFLTFLVSGAAVSMIAILYSRGGFDLVLGDDRGHCARLRDRDRRDRGSGQRRREGAIAGGGAGGVIGGQCRRRQRTADPKSNVRPLRNPARFPYCIRMAMSQPQGSVAGATTIKSVTPDVRAPSRSWSLACLASAECTPGRFSAAGA